MGRTTNSQRTIVNNLSDAIREYEGDDDVYTPVGHILAGLRDYIDDRSIDMGDATYHIIARAWLAGYEACTSEDWAVRVARDLIEQALTDS